MKTILIAILMSFIGIITTETLYAQKNSLTTDTITIRGNCGECKARIEDAAYLKGVKYASWDKKTKILTVKYNPQKASLDKICEAISMAGHDSEKYTASDKAYKKLPSCCAYRTGACHHE
jgi:periplasmic mercuric ion binding protein